MKRIRRYSVGTVVERKVPFHLGAKFDVGEVVSLVGRGGDTYRVDWGFLGSDGEYARHKDIRRQKQR